MFDVIVAWLILVLLVLGVVKLHDIYRTVRRWDDHIEEQTLLRTIRRLRHFDDHTLNRK